MVTLKGIGQYLQKFESEFRDNVYDHAEQHFQFILDDWKSHCKNPDYLKDMNEYVATLG